MKPRPNSLYSQLAPEQRDELLVLLVEQGASYAAGIKKLEAWGIASSDSSLSRFVSQHGLPWRLERARMVAESTEALPKNADKIIAQGRRKREFDLTFRELSVKEWALLESIDLEKRKQALKEKTEPAKLALMERRISLLEAAAEKAKEVLSDQKLTPEQQTAKMREVFGL